MTVNNRRPQNRTWLIDSNSKQSNSTSYSILHAIDVHWSSTLTKLQNFYRYKVFGLSNGLFCMADEIWDAYYPPRPIYLWNPASTATSLQVGRFITWNRGSMPKFWRRSHFHIVSIRFDFCGITGFNYYKLVAVSFHHGHSLPLFSSFELLLELRECLQPCIWFMEDLIPCKDSFLPRSYCWGLKTWIKPEWSFERQIGIGRRRGNPQR